jgi:hypothetical protein
MYYCYHDIERGTDGCQQETLETWLQLDWGVFSLNKRIIELWKTCQNGKEPSHCLHIAPVFIIVGGGRVKMAPPDFILEWHYYCWSGGDNF